MKVAYQDYVTLMNRLIKIRSISKRIGVAVFMAVTLICFSSYTHAQNAITPKDSAKVVRALNASQWQELEDCLQVIRAMTEDGVEVKAFRISPENYAFSIELQSENSGSRVKEIGEQVGAVVAVNAGFFATTGSSLYSVGYLRLNGQVKSKGWDNSGGIVSFKPDGIELTPTHAGIPGGDFDVIQSRPMLIEPGGKWAMGSNSGLSKPRTILCTLSDGEIILATVTRFGLTLFEAGWLMRSKADGGFFDCDAALAFDGGRSTQVWYSGDQKYSSSGLSPVHNFFVVRQKED